MQHRYQVGILGRTGDAAAGFVATLQKRFADLGLPADALSVLDETSIGARDRRAAFVAVFFGHPGATDAAHPVLKDLVADSVVIFPVVDDLARFTADIPAALHAYNGLATDPADPGAERLAGLVLEALRLLRASRRLFVSYKRSEARGAAIQVYETMDARTFDTFLDTHSIKPGEPFQDELWHRLADTDVMILLDTPGFRESRWTREELARANATNLQILQVLWPRPPIPAAAEEMQREVEQQAAFSRFLQLGPDDFETAQMVGPEARLRDATLERIAVAAESLRARALAARNAYLVDTFCKRARAQKLAPVVQSRLIALARPDGPPLTVVPAVGVPDARLYQQISEEFPPSGGGEPPPLWLLYDERGIRDAWLAHLAFLSRHVPIRAVPVIDSDAALREI